MLNKEGPPIRSTNSMGYTMDHSETIEAANKCHGSISNHHHQHMPAVGIRREMETRWPCDTWRRAVLKRLKRCNIPPGGKRVPLLLIKITGGDYKM